MGVPYSPIDCFNIFIAQSAAEVFFFLRCQDLVFFFFVGSGKSESPGKPHLQALGRVFRIFLCHNYGEKMKENESQELPFRETKCIEWANARQQKASGKSGESGKTWVENG